MAQLPGGNFNANDVDPNAGFEPLPAGDYAVMIIESSMEKTKAEDGEYLKLTFKVLAPEEFKGRQVWSNLNLINKNEKTVDIAQRELSSICHAIDVMNPEDSQELHGIPMAARIKVEPARGGYGPSNSISYFKNIEELDAEGEW